MIHAHRYRLVNEDIKEIDSYKKKITCRWECLDCFSFVTTVRYESIRQSKIEEFKKED